MAMDSLDKMNAEVLTKFAIDKNIYSMDELELLTDITKTRRDIVLRTIIEIYKAWEKENV